MLSKGTVSNYFSAALKWPNIPRLSISGSSAGQHDALRAAVLALVLLPFTMRGKEQNDLQRLA